MVNKKIFWISSYPKSGNTWMRAIISSIFFTKNGKFIFDYFKYVQSFDLDKRFEFVKKINQYSLAVASFPSLKVFIRSICLFLL